jgi:hypothetical protein
MLMRVENEILMAQISKFEKRFAETNTNHVRLTIMDQFGYRMRYHAYRMLQAQMECIGWSLTVVYSLMPNCEN